MKNWKILITILIFWTAGQAIAGCMWIRVPEVICVTYAGTRECWVDGYRLENFCQGDDDGSTPGGGGPYPDPECDPARLGLERMSFSMREGDDISHQIHNPSTGRWGNTFLFSFQYRLTPGFVVKRFFLSYTDHRGKYKTVEAEEGSQRYFLAKAVTMPGAIEDRTIPWNLHVVAECDGQEYERLVWGGLTELKHRDWHLLDSVALPQSITRGLFSMDTPCYVAGGKFTLHYMKNFEILPTIGINLPIKIEQQIKSSWGQTETIEMNVPNNHFVRKRKNSHSAEALLVLTKYRWDGTEGDHTTRTAKCQWESDHAEFIPCN